MATTGRRSALWKVAAVLYAVGGSSFAYGAVLQLLAGETLQLVMGLATAILMSFYSVVTQPKMATTRWRSALWQASAVLPALAFAIAALYGFLDGKTPLAVMLGGVAISWFGSAVAEWAKFVTSTSPRQDGESPGNGEGVSASSPIRDSGGH